MKHWHHFAPMRCLPFNNVLVQPTASSFQKKGSSVSPEWHITSGLPLPEPPSPPEPDQRVRGWLIWLNVPPIVFLYEWDELEPGAQWHCSGFTPKWASLWSACEALAIRSVNVPVTFSQSLLRGSGYLVPKAELCGLAARVSLWQRSLVQSVLAPDLENSRQRRFNLSFSWGYLLSFELG